MRFLKPLSSGALLALIFMAGTAFAGANVPTWTTGNWYETTEQYHLTTPLIGENGYIDVDMTSRYTVLGMESLTQEKGSQTVDVWNVEFASTSFTGTGQVDISDPLPLQGAARFMNGSFEGNYYVRTSDLALVRRNRVIAGDAEVEMGPGVWFPVGTLTITANEEYDAPMNDMKFPMENGDHWAQSLTVYGFGSYAHPLIGSSEFDESFTWDLTCDVVGMETLSTNQGSCETYHTLCTDAGTGATAENWYCPASGWFLKQKLTGVPLGGTGKIERVEITVDDYYFESTVETPTPTPTDTPTGTPPPTGAGAEVRLNGTTFTMGDTMNVDMRVYNNGASMFVHIYLVLELGGGFYFYPTFGTDPVSLYDGDLPTVDTGWFTLLQVPFTDPIGATVPLTWYAAMFDVNYSLVGNLSTAAATLQ